MPAARFNVMLESLLSAPSIVRRVAVIFCWIIASGVAPFLAADAQSVKGKKSTVQQRARGASILNEKNIETAPARYPFRIPQTGPVAVQLQILLDRAGFSPGIIDGAWGLNAAKAITFFANPDDSARLTGDSPPTVTSVD